MEPSATFDGSSDLEPEQGLSYRLPILEMTVAKRIMRSDGVRWSLKQYNNQPYDNDVDGSVQGIRT